MRGARLGDLEEILQLCRHIEAIDNLRFLLKIEVPEDSDAADYLDAMEKAHQMHHGCSLQIS